ncbi:YhgE/Pip domain-containing protein [Ruminiclostridium cellulolyticum]|uniref:YhgE/Pip C-terminal domain protein n=1 Tax=Ruminiclostridium cellulolyticum (strain ATCC 35319 / DSM 5812 / JCM 6584 / H10) TaxID=394503 RepID=B8I3G5_RUMCH|nr:YhgE/Pip domain-containing protein [Ruminiclostridium cellulolyticum]ACL76308.1 YhgE/Pip C-terminal domain protein [Ruminiclostridium cellulolyticum H10]
MQTLKKYKKFAVIVAVILIPLVYSFFYLDAFWDPYSKLDKLPVAVVNQDNGATIDGENRNLGKEITDNLKTDKNLKWVITSESDAKDGLENRRYYAMISIPGDFSKNISSAADIDKTQGNLIYTVNEKGNYLASQVLSRVTLEFKDKISKSVSEEIVGTLLDQIKDLPTSLKELDDGLKEIKDGAELLYDSNGKIVDGQKNFNDGVNKLNNGLADANNGSKTLIQGSKQLSDGAELFYRNLSGGSGKMTALVNGSNTFMSGLSNLNSGLNQLNSSITEAAPQISQLSKGTLDLNSGVQSYTSGVDKYIESVNKVSQTQSALANSIQKYVASHPEALTDPNFKAVIATLEASKSVPEQLKTAGGQLSSAGKLLTDGSGKVAGGVSQLTTQLSSAAQGINKLAAGSNELNKSYPMINQGILDTASSIKTASDKSKELSSGASSVNDGVAKLSSGISELAAGSEELSKNSGVLLDGETKIQDSLGKLKDGVTEASSGVSSSLLKADGKLNGTEGLKEYAADPVKITEKKVYGIPDYGTAFTPYFVSLSLWVGALLMFFAIYLDEEVRFRKFSSKSKGIMRFFAYTLIGIAQALVLDFVIVKGLHLEVANMGLFVLTSIIISLSFTSIMRFLLVQLRDVGKFLAILLLILQLTSCGGTFPMELVPRFFNVLNPFMPMTYSVNALREVIAGINNGFLAQNLIVLVTVMIGFLILNLVVSKLRFGSISSDSDDFVKISEEVSA